MTGSVSRRGFLAGLGAAGAGVGLAACGSHTAASAASVDDGTVTPYGVHQAGISTASQDRLAFAAFDISSGTTRAELVSMLQTWTAAIVRMTAGLQVSSTDEANPESPPQDTGEALGLGAGNLTVTVGFGPSLFDSRFGLAGLRPAALADLPALPGDQLDPTLSGGDICVQACSDDPQVAFHAVRNLRRLAEGTAVLRWTQLGFGKTSSTSTAQATPRNLMGFKDGTANIKLQDTARLNDSVWVGDETDQAWMRGGSYLVSRRIRMFLEAWDRDYLADQENVIGRSKDSGAPLGATTEFATPNLTATGDTGHPLIPATAHIRLASQTTNRIFLLRRGYSFTDGTDPETGELVAGLFFIAFQQDPRAQFVPLQRILGTSDAMNEYITHTSSGLFAVPPGFQAGQMIGHTLFA
jgi:deferrochelatase/peroxidase EfeB